jgi:FAD/FMN-containing dehydrogenase
VFGETVRSHEEKCARLAAEIAVARARGLPIGLRKSTSNLFRRRDRAGQVGVDVGGFNRVLKIDRASLTAEVEGMTTYEDLVDATLPHSLLPAVVPQLKTITIGGAISGLGIESSSFRFGLVHETVEEMEILLGDGRIVVCSPRQEPDLFYGFPNSYGTLGYALRARIRLIPAKRYVHVTHTRFSDPETSFEAVADVRTDYLDGTIFSGSEIYLTQGVSTDQAPQVSDYTYMDIYYRSIQRKSEDWLTARDYIWRWDTDWFWCSKHFYVQKPAVRFFARPMLNSRAYQRLMRLSQRLLPDSRGTESVIQDVEIPIENAPEFFRFLMSEIGITPVWVCPFRTGDSGRGYDLTPLPAGRLYINFGFWDVIRSQHEGGYFNKRIECMARKLGGMKGLYSSAYYDEATFWSIYDKPRYEELKRKYDPQGAFPDLYAKCVKGS